MNIFLHELRSYMKSAIIWACSMAGLAVLYIFLFSSIAHDIEAFKKLLESFPEALRKALNMHIESITTLEGFYSFVFIYVVLCGAIQAMNLGTSIISKEVREKTADFLLTKPVSRIKIMTSKLLAALSSLVTTNAIYLVITTLVASTVKSGPYSMKIFLMISFTLFFIQLIFLALGFIVSVIVPRIRSVISVSLSTVFGFFIVGMISSVIGEEATRYITPFKYFETAYIIENASYETPFIFLGIAIVLITITTSYLIYTKKDIHAV